MFCGKVKMSPRKSTFKVQKNERAPNRKRRLGSKHLLLFLFLKFQKQSFQYQLPPKNELCMAEAYLNRWHFHCVPEHRKVGFVKPEVNSSENAQTDFNPLPGTILG